MIRRASRLLAVLLVAVLLVAFGEAAHGADPVEITFASHPDSPWTLEVSVEESAIEARHAGYPGLVLEIDCDDEADDGRHPGVAPVFAGQRLEGTFWGSRAPFFYPILVPEEHALERVRVEAGPKGLRVRFEGGSYALLQPAAGDGPLFAEFVFLVEGVELTTHLDGLYYLLPSQHGTELRISLTGGEEVRRIDRSVGQGTTIVRSETTEIARLEPSGGQHREYFEDVARIELTSPGFGEMILVAWIERLQIQVDRNPDLDSDVFELDFDHAFKDRGQRTVMGRLKMTLPATAKEKEPQS